MANALPAGAPVRSALSGPGLWSGLDRAMAIQARAVDELHRALRGPLLGAVERALTLIESAAGRLIVSGMGKSGHIGRKVAATFASTGTPAQFVHPAEASHGDLGMVTAADVVLALSWSGETAELSDVIHHTRRFGVPLIAITSSAESSLARHADVALVLPKVTEMCPHGLTPTSSTLIQLALCDAMAVVLLEARGFRADDFRAFHPGGKLGAKLRLVADFMHPAPDIPLARGDLPMGEALLVITGHRFGTVGVVDPSGLLVGIVTDGDVRRHLAPGLLDRPVAEVMTVGPKTIRPDRLASEALDLMSRSKVTVLFVAEAGRPVGILHIHDLLRAGLV